MRKRKLCQLIIMWNMISRLMENFISQKDIFVSITLKQVIPTLEAQYVDPSIVINRRGQRNLYIWKHLYRWHIRISGQHGKKELK